MLQEHAPCPISSEARNRIVADVRRIVSESSGVPADQLDEKTLLRDLPWDSLDLVECTMELEEHFDVTISDDMIEEAKTIGDIIDGVASMSAQSADGS